MPPRPAVSPRARARVALVASLIALFLLVLFLINGCTPTAPQTTPSPQAPAVAFASDDEALAAAEKVSREYWAMSDVVYQESGNDPERMAQFVTEEWLVKDVEAAGIIAATQERQEGESRLDSFGFQQMYVESGRTVVMVYYCVDLTDVAIVDSAGMPVGDPPPPRQAVEATLTTVDTSSSTLLIAGLEPWADAKYCS